MAGETVPARKDSGSAPRGFLEITLEQLNSIANSTPRQFRRWVTMGLFFLMGTLSLIVGVAFSISLLAGHLVVSSGIAASGVLVWLVTGTQKLRRRSAKRDREDGTSG